MNHPIRSFFIILAVVVVGMFAAQAFAPDPTPDDPLLFPPGDPYTSAWAEVDRLADEALYRDAYQAVEDILQKARDEDNFQQIAKAAMHRMSYARFLEEDDQVKAIHGLDTLIAEAKYPLRPVLHSISAQLYWQYYLNHYWQFSQRTHTVDFVPDDLRTWDQTRIADQAIKHHLAALSNQDSLQLTPIATFEQILDEGNTTDLRPTLYDFLAHRAFDFFASTQLDMHRPIDQFELDQEVYLADHTAFCKQVIESTDTMATRLHAMRIMQDLLRFHRNDSTPEALVDADLKRLMFVKQYSTLPNTDDLYYDALQSLLLKHAGTDVSAEITYHLASWHVQRGSNYKPLEGEHYRFELLTAYEMCQTAVDSFPDAYGSNLCQALIDQLNSKSLGFESEEVVLPNQVGRIALQHKNLDTVYLRAIAVPNDYFTNDVPKMAREDYTKIWRVLAQKKALKSWSVPLKNLGDLQTHRTEVELPALPMGHYIVLVSSTPDFAYDKNTVGYAELWSSRLSYVSRQIEDNSWEISVRDRETGAPLAGVKAQLFDREYDYNKGLYVSRKGRAYTTDANGYFRVPASARYRNFCVDFTYGDDRYNNLREFYQGYNYEPERVTQSVMLFTDRGIYRPGQTIHFKGIYLEYEDFEPDVLKGENVSVAFIDANGEIVETASFTTNEYGTFNGQFTAPAGRLNGQMRLQTTWGSRYFRVEEYKRPKFEVTTEPLAGAYKLGSNVQVKGKATAYAGSSIDGAEVSWRVQRTPNFPWWCYWYFGFVPSANSTEIAQGQAITGADGSFTVDFIAEADETIDRKYQPWFSYTVTADVTDISGETRSTTQNVAVGYTAMKLSAEMPENLSLESKFNLAISSTNLNGEPTPTKGKVTIWKVEQPAHLLRERLWQAADQHQFSQAEYRERYPHDVRKNEDQKANWPRKEEVYSASFDTNDDQPLKLKGLDTWQAGVYYLEATATDAFGEQVIERRWFTGYDAESVRPAVNDYWWSIGPDQPLEPGQTAEFLIASAAPDVHVLYEVEYRNKIVSRQWLQLDQSQMKVKLPIEEKHRGNVAVHFTMIKDGRVHQESYTLEVPRTNQQLDIELQTFRNKLYPGQEEEWRLKIKGANGDKVMAEMLATMYDASLDAFASNQFAFDIYHQWYAQRAWNGSATFGSNQGQFYQENWNNYQGFDGRMYTQFDWGRFTPYNNAYTYTWDYGNDNTVIASSISANANYREGERWANEQTYYKLEMNGEYGATHDLDEVELTGATTGTYFVGGGESLDLEVQEKENLEGIHVRTNFSETAFFYPDLHTDENGDVIIKFTIPEALTRWKFLALAHTSDLKYSMIEEEVVTQKELMILPNQPRFFREGDRIIFPAKISNLSEKALSGQAELQLFDALTMESVDDLVGLKSARQSFQVNKGQSTALNWELEIPAGVGAITYRIVARAGDFSDGEERPIPVLTNRMLVTESLPLPIKEAGSYTFQFDKLAKSGQSSTLKHHALTLEFTNNPAWYAVQALPYMMEYPYECAEQTFSRFYANSLATHIVNSNPKIKQVFDRWSQSSPEAFLSNLEKNQELKSLMLEETPWLMQARNESERKQRVATLFDLNRMSYEQDKALGKLQQAQASSGGWPWFPGMPESRYITQHVVCGLGHLDNLGVRNVRTDRKTWQMTTKAINYLDQKLLDDFEEVKKNHPNTYLKEQFITETQVQYLYARSYFTDVSMSGAVKQAQRYYLEQATTYWQQFAVYSEGMIALSLHRYQDSDTPDKIMASLKQRAIQHDELGMYWKGMMDYGYYWYEAPIETQALLIEAFDEVANDEEAVAEMKVWLLKQKQTQDWRTTKATTEACYALLLRGTDVLASDEIASINIGGISIKEGDPTQPTPPNVRYVDAQAGTGYIKTRWDGENVRPDMATVKVDKTTDGVAWGAVYWQYFEDLDKITPHQTPLQLEKKLFREDLTEAGPVLTEIKEGTELKPGDKIKVRIELRVDRAMEFVHMKDMRASGFEPINVLSTYRWQDGLGYYESTRDAATNFFFDYLPRGAYVFEYPLRVAHRGDFSNGITTIQSMYAPEFTSHSEGIRVKVQTAGN